MNIPKRVIFMCMQLFIIAHAMAQELKYKQHDISIGVGVLPVPTASIGVVPTAFSAQYICHISKCVGIGTLISCSPIRSEERAEEFIYFDEQGKSHVGVRYGGENVGVYSSLMGAASFSWVNTRIFTLYSKIAVGFSFGSDKSLMEFAGQLSPVGFTLGGSLHVMFELGIGRQGLLVLGAGYRF